MVFLFVKLCLVDIILGFEMKLIGEVMGKDLMFEKVLYKGLVVFGINILMYGLVIIIVVDKDKEEVMEIVKCFYEIGYNLLVIVGIV